MFIRISYPIHDEMIDVTYTEGTPSENLDFLLIPGMFAKRLHCNCILSDMISIMIDDQHKCSAGGVRFPQLEGGGNDFVVHNSLGPSGSWVPAAWRPAVMVLVAGLKICRVHGQNRIMCVRRPDGA